MYHRLLRLLPLCALVSVAGNTMAAGKESAAAIAAKRFLASESRHLGKRVEIEVQDSGAQWPECNRPTAFLPANGRLQWGRTTVGIRCVNAPHTRYLQAQIRAFGHYWVTTEAVPAGTELTSGLLKRVEGEISALPRGTLRQRAQIVGQIASRPLRAESALQHYQLKARPLVSRRQPVTLVASGQGFRIAREGRALDEGSKGERVRVRLPNRRVISGLVTGPGTISVTQTTAP